MLLNNLEITKEIKEEILKKYRDSNDNKKIQWPKTYKMQQKQF